MARTLITMPKSARRGDIIEIRALIAHVMETGFRTGSDGKVAPRDIIRSFTCRYNGEVIFAAELFPSISANPYIAFYTVATESGRLEFAWEGDNGFAQSESVQFTVTG